MGLSGKSSRQLVGNLENKGPQRTSLEDRGSKVQDFEVICRHKFAGNMHPTKAPGACRQ